ncbi:MAG: limonene-1,2-epoxide hydrolase family protein [Gammaproteobacteria bacterium]
MEANIDKTLNRRDLVTGAGLVTVGLLTQAMQQAHAGGHTAKRELLTEEQQLALEQANDELVTNFINDYAKRDAELLASYMADDIIYQVTEGMPEVVGKDAYIKRNSDMFAGLEKIDWITLRQFTIGQVVINDRIDEFYPYPGSKVPRMRFRVTGYFLIDDGKIKVWRDFGYPGEKQLVQPAPKA